MDKKAKVGAGKIDPYSSDMAKVDKAKTSEVDHLPENFSHKLFASKAKTVSGDDPRLKHASRIWDYDPANTRQTSDEFIDAKEGRLSKGLKKDKSSDCAQWHGGISKDGTKADFLSRRADEQQ
jgi:hypothetical protein